MARLGEVDTGLPGPIAQQGVRRLDHAAGPVANQRIGADRAAVIEIDENPQALVDDVVGFMALDVGHEANAARIVFVTWVVKSLCLRQIGQNSTAAPF